MFGFVVVAWFGLEQLIDSKLRIRAGVRGHDRLEEIDPLERMRRMAAGTAGGAGTASSSSSDGSAAAGARRRGGAGAGAGGTKAAPGVAAATAAPEVTSLEQELAEMHAKLGDTRKFDYVPVPRTDDEDE